VRRYRWTVEFTYEGLVEAIIIIRGKQTGQVDSVADLNRVVDAAASGKLSAKHTLDPEKI